MSRLFTSESVMPGHPDKMCDRIADEILDAIIEAQPSDRKSLARPAASSRGFACSTARWSDTLTTRHSGISVASWRPGKK